MRIQAQDVRVSQGEPSPWRRLWSKDDERHGIAAELEASWTKGARRRVYAEGGRLRRSRFGPGRAEEAILAHQAQGLIGLTITCRPAKGSWTAITLCTHVNVPFIRATM